MPITLLVDAESSLIPVTVNRYGITVPTMIIHGQYDDVADTKQLMPFFEQLPNANKRYVVVPNAGHMMMYQKQTQ